MAVWCLELAASFLSIEELLLYKDSRFLWNVGISSRLHSIWSHRTV